jgi:hypothetical protein
MQLKSYGLSFSCLTGRAIILLLFYVIIILLSTANLADISWQILINLLWKLRCYPSFSIKEIEAAIPASAINVAIAEKKEFKDFIDNKTE